PIVFKVKVYAEPASGNTCNIFPYLIAVKIITSKAVRYANGTNPFVILDTIPNVSNTTVGVIYPNPKATIDQTPSDRFREVLLFIHLPPFVILLKKVYFFCISMICKFRLFYLKK